MKTSETFSLGSPAAVGAVLRVPESTSQRPRAAESRGSPPHGSQGGPGPAAGLRPLPDHLHREEHPEERLLPLLRQGNGRATPPDPSRRTRCPQRSLWSRGLPRCSLQGCFLWFLCHPVLFLVSAVFNEYQREKVRTTSLCLSWWGFLGGECDRCHRSGGLRRLEGPFTLFLKPHIQITGLHLI